METKESLLKALKQHRRLPTSRVAAIVGISHAYALELLEQLRKERAVTKQEETLATYWTVRE